MSLLARYSRNRFSIISIDKLAILNCEEVFDSIVRGKKC